MDIFSVDAAHLVASLGALATLDPIILVGDFRRPVHFTEAVALAGGDIAEALDRFPELRRLVTILTTNPPELPVTDDDPALYTGAVLFTTTQPQDLRHVLAVEDDAEHAGTLAADDRRTCGGCRTWVTAAHLRSDDHVHRTQPGLAGVLIGGTR